MFYDLLKSAIITGLTSVDTEKALVYCYWMQWYEELSRSYSQRDIINSYMDKGITGTQTNKRLEFMRMIDNSLHSSFGLWLET